MPYSQASLDNRQTSDPTKLSLNLKNRKIRDFVLTQLIPKVQFVLESYRPGVMERFGLGPDSVHRINPKLIYVRVSGYGHQHTKLQQQAGRDLNYLAASGMLSKFRRNADSAAPAFPGNLLTYYAGGSIYTFTLILQALLQQRQRTVIDCSLARNMSYTS